MKRRDFLAITASVSLTAGLAGKPMELFSAEKQKCTAQKPFSFVVIGDPHVGIAPASYEGFEQLVADIGNLAEKPDFVVTAGDIAAYSPNRKFYTFYRDVMRRLGIKVYNVVGNHDVTKKTNSREMFKEFFGPNYYSFDHGGIHFVVLDSAYPPYAATIDDNELKWLEQDLSGVDKSTPIMVFLHHPIHTTLVQRSKAAKNNPGIALMNPERVMDVFEPYNLKMVFQGHLHENECLRKDGTEFFSVGSAGGAWWGRDNYEQCPDGSPRGYMIVKVNGTNTAVSYKAVGRDVADAVDIILPKGPSITGRQCELTVNVFCGDDRTKVAYRFDQGPWKKLKLPPKPIVDPRIAKARSAFPSPHIWSDSITVAEDHRQIEVQVTDQYGAISRRRVPLLRKSSLSK